ncbi:hypothetical protein CKO15_11785 [Halorhodospira abdelmalekii]|nr:hypothetical protein [Halorhodospira abdelmalekii]
MISALLFSLLLLLLPLLPLSAGGSAVARAELSDPTAPPALRQKAGSATPRASPPPRVTMVRLHGSDGADRMAYINNQWYRRGEHVGSFYVEQIDSGGVTLSGHGERYRIPLTRTEVIKQPRSD